MSVFRGITSVLVVVLFFYAPGLWWLVLLSGATLFFPFYIEGLLFALWYDLLYGPLGKGAMTGFGLDFSVFFLIGLLLLLSLFFRDRFSVGRAQDRYLR
jgi:hypothetical protein